MSDCYYYERYTLPKGTLDSSIDCMYVLIMDGSEQYETIKKQIKQAGIVSKVVIQHNLGYKKCDKNLKVNGTNRDLIHAVQTVFKDAVKRNYERIIVLEEDCTFDERIRQKDVIQDLNTFFIQKNPDVYNLGPFIHVSNPIDILLHNKHKFLFLNGGSHCNVYNKKYFENKASSDFYTASPDMETNLQLNTYSYHVPLAYQLLNETENSKEGWGILKPISDFLFIKASGIDKKVQPGYDVIYKVCDVLSVLIFLFLLYIWRQIYRSLT